MRKLSFLSLSFIALLSFSSCTKDAIEKNVPTGNAPSEPRNAYTVAYSGWEAEEALGWSDDNGGTAPGRRTELSAPMLTSQALDAGTFVMVYAKSNVTDAVVPMPAVSVGASGEVNTYEATPLAGVIGITRTKSVNGIYEMPVDGQEFQFRYIVITPVVNEPNARVATLGDFSTLTYEETIALFNIPG
jgi:hypothetical protein